MTVLQAIAELQLLSDAAWKVAREWMKECNWGAELIVHVARETGSVDVRHVRGRALMSDTGVGARWERGGHSWLAARLDNGAEVIFDPKAWTGRKTKWKPAYRDYAEDPTLRAWNDREPPRELVLEVVREALAMRRKRDAKKPKPGPCANAWSGVVSLIDGHVEECYTYEQAAEADFHHSFLVSSSGQERMREGTSAYFFLTGDGEVVIDWRRGQERPGGIDLASRIREQLR